MAKRIKQPSKQAQLGLIDLLAFFRVQQAMLGLTNDTPELFRNKNTKQIEQLHAAIDWIYMSAKDMELI